MSQPKNIEVKYLTEEELSAIAEDLLNHHNPHREFPVPIEDIAELRLGISILPVPNLKKDKSIDAYLSHDFTHIVIDDDCYKHVETRARFSVAHEIAHSVLHRTIYESQNITTEDELIEFTRSLPSNLMRRIEWQSYALAGFILVPRSEFCPMVDATISAAGGVENLSLLDLSTLVDDLRGHFKVSGEVIQRRFKADYPEVFESFFNV